MRRLLTRLLLWAVSPAVAADPVAQPFGAGSILDRPLSRPTPTHDGRASLASGKGHRYVIYNGSDRARKTRFAGGHVFTAPPGGLSVHPATP